jgi:hypothetical protein
MLAVVLSNGTTPKEADMSLKKVGLVITRLVMASLALGIGPVAAQQAVCPGLDSGKIDTSGDPASVTVTAPEGFLISGYCVKAGSDESDAGVEFITVDPPQATVTISHTSGKAVSHYSYSLVAIETPPSTPPTTPPSTETPPKNPPETEVLGTTTKAEGGESGGTQVTAVPSGGVQTGGGSTAGLEAPGMLGLGVVLLVTAGAMYLVRRRKGQTA